MSASISDIRDRLSRAESEHMSVRAESYNPMVLTVINEDSESEYTLVPGAAFCSCPDKTYRNVPLCKHALFVLTERTIGYEQLADRIESRRSSYETERERLQEELSEVEEELEVMDFLSDEVAEIDAEESQDRSESDDWSGGTEDYLVSDASDPNEFDPEDSDIDVDPDHVTRDPSEMDSIEELLGVGEDASIEDLHDDEPEDEFETMVEDLSS